MWKPVFAVALSLSLAGGCQGGSKDQGPARALDDPKPNPAPPVPKPSDAAATTSAGSDDNPSLKSHMLGHFAAILQIQRAIVVGDVEVAKQLADEFSKHEAHEDVVEYDVELKRMRSTASSLAKADSLDVAASLAANLAGECGNCHSTMTRIVSFEWFDIPKDSGETTARMQRHLWAMDRLWEGLVGPSDSLWAEGAAVLAAKPLPAEQIAPEPGVAPQVKIMAATLQALGRQAVTAAEQDARSSAYGEILKTCAACHGIARK